MLIMNRHNGSLVLPTGIVIGPLGSVNLNQQVWDAMKGSQPVKTWLTGGYLVEEASKVEPELVGGPIALAADRDASPVEFEPTDRDKSDGSFGREKNKKK